MAGGRENRLGGVAVESTRPDIRAKLGGRLVCRALRPVGARLAHRLVGVCGAENPSQAGDGRTGEAPRVAGSDTDTDRNGATVPTRPLNIAVSAHTSASPEQVLAAARDFSERRPKLWPNVKAKHFEVHDEGADFADVTEGIWITGLFWERSLYDWSEPGAVRATVTDSNAIQPGSTFGLSAVPSEGGSDVEMTLCRTFRKGPKGRIGSAINHLSGNRGWRSYLRRVLANVEKTSSETAASARPVVSRSAH